MTLHEFYSQYKIEKQLIKLFKEPGYFLEIGCWDGELISQTAYLERFQGWTGLCVDPFAVHFERRHCELCTKAISADGKPRKFIKVSVDRRHGGDVSYFSGFEDSIEVHWPLIKEFCDYEEIEVETITIAQLFEQYDVPNYIEFLSIDTEGSELEILQSIDFEQYRFGLIAYEHNGNNATRLRVHALLDGNGYNLLSEPSSEDAIYQFNHKKWLDNEYRKWIEALQASTVHNFKEHPMVQRMLGSVNMELFSKAMKPLEQHELDLAIKIDSIGYDIPTFTGTAMRMIYYARQVIERDPKSIVEIGGGAGEFYAILRMLGYKGTYMIMDLPEVQAFQASYLAEVSKQTELNLPLTPREEYDFCVSFYALGEFDDELKKYYVENVINKCRHGLVLWNPHSGSSAQIPFECTVTDEYPLTYPGNKQLSW